MTQTVPAGGFETLRSTLASRGYTFEDRPHQIFLARGRGAVVNLYASGKVVIGGSSAEEKMEVERIVDELAGRTSSQPRDDNAPSLPKGTRVGTDEAGKGDYFGPLVAAAVLATESQVENLIAAGVKDSKSLRPEVISRLAATIKNDILASGQWRIVRIPPEKYNALYLKMENLNKMLGWAHARALEDVLAFPEPCTVAIADQFGDARYIEQALFARGKTIQLVQTPKAERDPVVAAASILARDEFVRAMNALDAQYKVHFPLGASQVEDFARDLVAKHGSTVLLDTAKVHFSTTQRVTSDAHVLQGILRARADLKQR